MEKEFDQHGPMVVQVRRYNGDSTDYWENVKGYDEERGQLIMAEPDDKFTMKEALDIYHRVNPEQISYKYRVVHWHWPERRA